MNYKIVIPPQNSMKSVDFTIKECDKFNKNIYIVTNKSMEKSMSAENYKRLETTSKGYRLILEFPDKSDKESVIHEEVKQLLSNLLHEQIMKIS